MRRALQVKRRPDRGKSVAVISDFPNIAGNIVAAFQEVQRRTRVTHTVTRFATVEEFLRSDRRDFDVILIAPAGADPAPAKVAADLMAVSASFLPRMVKAYILIGNSGWHRLGFARHILSRWHMPLEDVMGQGCGLLLRALAS